MGSLDGPLRLDSVLEAGGHDANGGSFFSPAPEPDGVNAVGLFGWILTAVGLVGYGLGVGTPYPGRAFAITAVMAGVALVAMQPAFEADEVDA